MLARAGLPSLCYVYPERGGVVLNAMKNVKVYTFGGIEQVRIIRTVFGELKNRAAFSVPGIAYSCPAVVVITPSPKARVIAC